MSTIKRHSSIFREHSTHPKTMSELEPSAIREQSCIISQRDGNIAGSLEQQHASHELLPEWVCSGLERRDGNAGTKEIEFVPACTQQALAIGERQTFHLLQAEYSLPAPLFKNSFLELRKAFRASQPYEPMPLCLPPLETPVLETLDISGQSGTSTLTDSLISGHLFMSVESFLASLSLLESLWGFAENCPSIPALYCETILQRDPYRDSHEVSVARAIMEHIDTHHATISREVNIELGSTYTSDPLPEVSDNRCRCPLQRLHIFNIPRNRPDAIRKVRCDVTVRNQWCTNCVLDGIECVTRNRQPKR